MPKFRTLEAVGGHPAGTVLEGEVVYAGDYIKIEDSRGSLRSYYRERFEEISEDTEGKEDSMEPEVKPEVKVKDNNEESPSANLLGTQESLVDASMESIREILELVRDSGGAPSGGCTYRTEVLFGPEVSSGYVILKQKVDPEGGDSIWSLPEFKIFKNFGSAKNARRRAQSKETNPSVSYRVHFLRDLKLVEP